MTTVVSATVVTEEPDHAHAANRVLATAIVDLAALGVAGSFTVGFPDDDGTGDEVADACRTLAACLPADPGDDGPIGVPAGAVRAVVEHLGVPDDLRTPEDTP